MKKIILKKSLSALLILTILLSSISLSKTSAEAAQSPVDSKWIESDIIGNVTSDMNISYKDDFNSAVSKEWLSTTKLPSGYNSYGAFSEADDIMRERKLSLIKDTSIQSHDAELVRTLYSLSGDWTSRNNEGTSPAQPYIDAINSIKSIADLTSYLSNMNLNPSGINLFNISIEASLDDATKYTVYIDEPDYFLNYSDDYTKISETGQLKYDYYMQLSTYMLQRFGLSEKEASNTFDGAIKFESMMAKYLYSENDLYSSDYIQKIHNIWSLTDIQAKEGSCPISGIITSLGYGNSSDYTVSNPEYLIHISDLYAEKNLSLIKDYLLAHTAVFFSKYLDKQAYEKTVSIHHNIYGGSGLLSDEQYCYNVVNDNLEWPLDNLYVDKFCTLEMQKRVAECGEEVISYYREMLQNEDWLSESTKAYAIEKLDKMTIHAVIPEKKYDYSTLSLTDDQGKTDYLTAILQIKKFKSLYELSKIGQNIDQDLWDMPTSEVNAYYDPSLNAVYFLAGQLVPPLLYDEDNYEEFLALVGSTFGHEISHAFDINGAQFDAGGNLNDWWTSNDYTAFQNKTQKVIDYLGTITPFDDKPSLHVNGEQIASEYIADLVAFKPLFAIASKHPDFNYDLFFQAYSTQWRTITTKEKEISRSQSDVHPLNYLRVNSIMQQLQPFYDTYDINAGDGMYLAPEDRLEVW